MEKVNYGIDAPGIMRNLLFFGAFTVIAAFAIPLFTGNAIFKYLSCLVILIGIIFSILGIAMSA